jgi:hypothetical protein
MGIASPPATGSCCWLAGSQSSAVAIDAASMDSREPGACITLRTLSIAVESGWPTGLGLERSVGKARQPLMRAGGLPRPRGVTVRSGCHRPLRVHGSAGDIAAAMPVVVGVFAGAG